MEVLHETLTPAKKSGLRKLVEHVKFSLPLIFGALQPVEQPLSESSQETPKTLHLPEYLTAYFQADFEKLIGKISSIKPSGLSDVSDIQEFVNIFAIGWYEILHKVTHPELGATHFVGFGSFERQGDIIANQSDRIIGTGEAFDGNKTKFIFTKEGVQILKEDIITFILQK